MDSTTATAELGWTVYPVSGSSDNSVSDSLLSVSPRLNESGFVHWIDKQTPHECKGTGRQAPLQCWTHSVSTGFARAAVPRSHMKPGPLSAGQNQSLRPLHIFPTTSFRLLTTSPKRRKMLSTYLLVHFNKATGHFVQLCMLLWFVLKMASIIAHHAVSSCTKRQEEEKEPLPSCSAII